MDFTISLRQATAPPVAHVLKKLPTLEIRGYAQLIRGSRGTHKVVAEAAASSRQQGAAGA